MLRLFNIHFKDSDVFVQPAIDVNMWRCHWPCPIGQSSGYPHPHQHTCTLRSLLSGHHTKHRNEPRHGRHWESRGKALAETWPKQNVPFAPWNSSSRIMREKCSQRRKESPILLNKCILAIISLTIVKQPHFSLVLNSWSQRIYFLPIHFLRILERIIRSFSQRCVSKLPGCMWIAQSLREPPRAEWSLPV